MQSISVVFSTLHCEGYTADLRYIACSLLLGVLAGSLKSYPPFWKARDSLLGNDTFPNLYDALVYERKLRVNIWGDKFTRDYLRENLPSWNSSRIGATYEPSVYTFVFHHKIYRESKRTLIKANFISYKCATRQSRRAREPSRIPLLFLLKRSQQQE